MAKLLLLVTTLLVWIALAATEADRKTLIDAAIREAKQQASLQSSHTSSNRAAHALAAFKTADPRLIEQGNARLLFEDIVRRAEKKILASQQAAVQANDVEARAEILAQELLHTPGSVLTEDETTEIYQESGCPNIHTEPDVDCNDPTVRRYRTANGECNNLDNPLYGAAERVLRRLLPPRYEDGIAQLRGTMQSMNMSMLPHEPFRPPYPSARIISDAIVRDRIVEEDQFSHILMQWGQWIDHDLDEVPAFNDCLPGCTIKTDRCVPIPVPTDDQSFGDPLTAGPVCHPFARSVPACDSSPPAQLGPREQINSLTSWIDASQVYGSSQKLQDRLRDGSTAYLRTGDPIPSGGGASLPCADQTDTANGFVGCPPPLSPSDCFLAGDIRVNEQTALTVFHTLWVREHNRVAKKLKKLNPAIPDNGVFKLAREIVAAEIQKITYHDYLPIILGNRFFNQVIKSYVDAGEYDPRINPDVPNGFAAAAYRYGHSQIRPVLDRLTASYEDISAGPLGLGDAFFNPSQYAIGEGTDPILRGLIHKPVRTIDEFVNSILTTQLFGSMDLATLNIQRGRDHGIPPYMVWKKWATQTCGETSDFRNELTYIRLLQTYGSLDTVDLWVGGLAEEPVPGGLVGATFACIFAQTFGPIRNGDRFYFENVRSDSNPYAFFTATQRDEIKKTSLSRIICDNSDNIREIQRNAFRLNRSRVQCSQIESMDLSVFANAYLPPTTPPPTSPSPTSPSPGGLCAIKVKIGGNRNRIQLESQSYLHYDRPTIRRVQVYPRKNTVCVPFLCPEPGQEVRLRISAPRRCREVSASRNSLLPPNTRYYPRRAYQANLHKSHIGTNTGAYGLTSACKYGTAYGLFFRCGRYGIQSDEDLLYSLEDALAQDEPHKVNENTNEKLIALLEEYTQELKGDTDEVQQSVEYNQAYLPSDLEDALNGLPSDLEDALNGLQ